MRQGPLRIPEANHATLVFYRFFPIKAAPQGGVVEPLECTRAPCACQGRIMPPSFCRFFPTKAPPQGGVGEPLECAKAPCAFQGRIMPPSFS